MLTVEHINIYIMMTTIIRDVSFTLDAGGCLCLIGPSGCGKTTILRAIAGLLDIDSGNIDNRFTRTAYLFQEPRLLPWRTALENVLLVNPHADKTAAHELFTILGLDEEDRDKYPHELSGGMRQRVALARALITEPDLLLMDEPFSALDHQLRQQLQQLICTRIEQQGMAVCMVTHDRDEAVIMAKEILRLDGKPATTAHHIQLDRPYSERDNDWIREQTQSPLFTHIEPPK